MLLSWLSKLFSSLLVSILFVTTLGLVANQTVLSSHYLEGKLQKENAYSELSTALSSQIANNNTGANAADASQLTAQLKTIITPEVLKQKLNSTLEQLEAYFKSNGQAPTIDVSDLVARAEAAGVPAPSDQNLTKPITIGKASSAKAVQNRIAQVKLAALAAIALLTAGLVGIAFKRRNFSPLANVLVSLGAMLSVTGATLFFLHRLAEQIIHINGSSNAFLELGNNLVRDVSQDYGKRVLIIGIIVLVAGIVVRVLIGRAQKPKPATPIPDASADALMPVTAEPPQSIAPTPSQPKPPKLIQ